MKNYYLIDYENIKTSGLASIKYRFKKSDEIYVFYSDKVNTMNIETMNDLRDRELDIRYMKVKNGQKDALDWQLATFLGYLVRKLRKKDYKIHIVTRDKGFNILLSFWEDDNIDIINIEEEPSKKKTENKKEEKIENKKKEIKTIKRAAKPVNAPKKKKEENPNCYLLAVDEGDYQGVYQYSTHKQRQKIEKMITCDKDHKRFFTYKEKNDALKWAGVNRISSSDSITMN